MNLHTFAGLRARGTGRHLTAGVAAVALFSGFGNAQTVTPGPALTLSDVLRAARQQHPLVGAAQARARASRGDRTTAGTFPDPVLTYQVENARFPGSSAILGLDRETSIFATLPLEPIFQRWSRVGRADAEVRAADADLVADTRRVALDAARAWYRAALAQLSLAGALEWRDGLQQLVEYNRPRVAEGVTAEGDLIRLQVERDRAAATATLERVELLRARAELAAFLGRSSAAVAGESLVVAVEEQAPVPSIGDLDLYIERARRLRPELLSARARAVAAGSEAAYQRALTIPQIGASVGVKDVGGTRTLLAGISAPLPLFDRNRGGIRRAVANHDAAEFDAEWVDRRVVAELAAAHEVARILGAPVQSLDASFLERAETSHRVALAAYQDGATPLLNVIDAARSRTEARLTYYRTVFAFRVSLLELNVLAGADPLAPPAPGTGGDSPSLTFTSRDGGRP